MSPSSVGPGTPLLEARNLRKVYMSGRTITLGHSTMVQAVDGISFSLDGEEAIGLVGESGSGKSTTGRMLLGLEAPTRGQVLFKGRDIGQLKGDDWHEYRAGVQSVFQDPWSSLNPRRTIGRSLAEPLAYMTDLSRKDRDDRAAELLELVGLSSTLTRHYPHELSGGMRQRVSIARAIAPWPACIVLDEPVSSLDVSIKAQVMNLLKDLQEKLQVSYVLIAHDLATVRFLTNRTIVMRRGRMVEFAGSEQLFGNPLHPYTLELLAASKATSIPGSGPSADLQDSRRSGPSQHAAADGGVYCARCDVGMETCPADVPDLGEVEPGHYVACARYDPTFDGVLTRDGHPKSL